MKVTDCRQASWWMFTVAKTYYIADLLWMESKFTVEPGTIQMQAPKITKKQPTSLDHGDIFPYNAACIWTGLFLHNKTLSVISVSKVWRVPARIRTTHARQPELMKHIIHTSHFHSNVGTTASGGVGVGSLRTLAQETGRIQINFNQTRLTFSELWGAEN